ncbi:MAG: AEC family transporter [Arenicellales bacterium]|nr:AEC family transporter [Arenicellales bacterium]MDP7155220.1 AEC family transporter [Arenicellales bacterium]MDP7283708.1 AEC family transporter [Arenicellales bacterium]MDP7481694.1 AEC family transporter [Arenicellales bacterium]HJL65390.1 AEC family transporter [Arenicellales bacterium]
MIYQIFSIMLPVVAIAMVGLVYARRYDPDMGTANRINLQVFLPALIFSVMTGKEFQIIHFPWLALAAVAIYFGSGVLAWPVARILGYNNRTFIPPMMMKNCGNLGLPLAIFAFGPEALPAAIVLFIVTNSLHFSFGVYMMDHRIHLLELLKSPLVVVPIIALGLLLLEIKPPPLVVIPIQMLGEVSIPLMLFSLGARLAYLERPDWKMGVIGGVVCPLTGLLIALAVQPLLHLPVEQFRVLLLFSVLPPAVLVYLLAERFDQEPQKVSAIVGFGNIGALITIPAVLPFILP